MIVTATDLERHFMSKAGDVSSLYLSPNQRNLLVAALASNQPSTQEVNMSASKDSRNGATSTYTPNHSTSSAPSSGHLELADDSPFLDYPLDGDGDDSFTYNGQGQMFADMNDEDNEDGNEYDHLHDKRKSMGDGDNDDDEEGGGKRREGEDRQAKKPGRKPLTSEPTSVSCH